MEPAPRTPDAPPRIDVHVHMVSTREHKGAFLKKGAVAEMPTRFLTDVRHSLPPLKSFLHKHFDDWYVNGLVKKLRRSQYVDKAVLLAFDAVYHSDGRPDPERTLACIPNDVVCEAAAPHEELLFGASVNPYRPDALDELDRCIEHGAVLIKWVPNSQNIDPADERIGPFYERMAALGLPLLSHTGFEHALCTHDQSFGDPRRLTLALDCGVNVIAAHAGASGIHDPVEYFHHYVEMLGERSNLYGDLSALTWENRKPYLMQLSADLPHLYEKMVHGTDYPVPVWPMFFKKEVGLGNTLAKTLSRNYFDVEVSLKLAAGMPESVLDNAAAILRL